MEPFQFLGALCGFGAECLLAELGLGFSLRLGGLGLSQLLGEVLEFLVEVAVRLWRCGIVREDEIAGGVDASYARDGELVTFEVVAQLVVQRVQR
jgi:hypothetical protein